MKYLQFLDCPRGWNFISIYDYTVLRRNRTGTIQAVKAETIITHPESAPRGPRMKRTILISCIVLLIILAIFLTTHTPCAANIWCLLTGRGYSIPEESSVFTFRTLRMNDGSGEWWLYGEDTNNYYYFTGETSRPYIAFSKNEAIHCKGFEITDYTTWCTE